MDVKINLNDLEELIENGKLKIDDVVFKKMLFIYNALEDGLTIKKSKKLYTFSKNHEGKKEILEDEYLLKFMKNNFDLKKILS